MMNKFFTSAARSITVRLTLLFAVISLAVYVSLGYFVIRAISVHFEMLDYEELEGKAKLIRNILSETSGGTKALESNLRSRLDEALVGHHDLEVSIGTNQGHEIYKTGLVFPEPLFATTVNIEQFHKGDLREWSVNSQRFRGSVLSLQYSGRDGYVIGLALNMYYHEHFLEDFQHTLWLSVIGAIVLTMFLGWAAARLGLKPLRTIVNLAQTVRAGRLNERLKLDEVPNELRNLSGAFNDMLARLEDAFVRLSDFSADLAHELRTPVNNLLMQTEVTLARARATEEYRDILYSNLEELGHLARMISDMLFLAKSEHGLELPSRQRVDLENELKSLMEFYEMMAHERDVSLVLKGQAYVNGDRIMLRRAIGNLISNAIRYTPAGSQVTLTLHQRGEEGAEIILENPAPQFTPDQLARLFDRFYRADAARGQESNEGTGLGLAISRSIFRAHGGDLEARLSGGAIQFVAALPPVKRENQKS
ncbi:MAG: heavy metal sensor histidine kinase [Gammaproteobacteria bacterium]|nr:heavy metal sensor histidine kinase [Gammaproteobacteria bacterium]